MNETSKMYEIRMRRGDFDRYLHGHGIDIGCGPDPLVAPYGTVDLDKWDTPQGDATLMEGVPDNSYDFVYSSHCLEHLKNPYAALRRWIAILKPGGYLYFVVPDYELYEQQWPSKFNPTHQWGFSIRSHAAHVLSMFKISQWLKWEGVEFCEMRLEDYGYDYAVGTTRDQTLGDAVAQICYIGQKK
jgi:predicted SAM-dependent methyltransferase